MSTGNRSPDAGRPKRGTVPATSANAGWTIFSYLLAGMVVYGAIGWLAGHWAHMSILFPVGMLVGLAVGIGGVIYRYGRS